ncbi:hypothetical protein [Dyadobacter sandarakinus]|uniref:DUF551 domain-containing protein n=1 Tax=Dyadobacter sandarakinus TaxID=2747268 RepID=A0ABX7I3W3_9BACT|nr:hypothetical protein [Dyadobacter sandarakinus]QRQ99735.1 hypothetical protein HWI92_01785 [Dyadobacter sandarakinus]
MTKQDAIQSAYGHAWERVKDELLTRSESMLALNSDEIPSFIECFYDEDDPFSPEALGFDRSQITELTYQDTYLWRPSVLDGLESNNGWIKIEEQEPEDAQLVEYCINGVPGDDIEQWSSIKNGTGAGLVTHWRRYVPHKPPIY